jgi:hypothetical protein
VPEPLARQRIRPFPVQNGRSNCLRATAKEKDSAMNEKTLDQIEEDILSYELSDEAVEAAGTRTEIAGAWTFVCTGVGCNYGPYEGC